MTRVAIVNNGLSNLDSIFRVLQECGANPFVTSTPAELQNATRIVLPGVGSFGKAMQNLRETGLADQLQEMVVTDGVPFMGICLGMQLVTQSSEEDAGVSGLAWVDAKVKKLQTSSPTERIPHVGWNEIFPSDNVPLFEGIPAGTDFYFVHSYHVDCGDVTLPISHTPYCGDFVSAIAKDNIMGVQFHPEKSQKAGFRLLNNFLKI
ncbi:imidazole glycerol phosphate synthase subunit HisH [Magnetovibrio blakemorei]|uniref:Imidazole glycerol phosphate synthase subunit HisH n=1 Tax=Magnetovibrio blakemorei TaxID=28181 RepID=A0A1E5Q6E0_9PROT|nr:imidazole glycerol phosphate synthase subunit HisH [Magnetovibrio blakemorei]OEJ66323.1 imidazole glycerol phosphate synthase, glutamine amidotransferase subunit [Magnetovibrio blakemorei]